mgnify:CR=1 FL=1
MSLLSSRGSTNKPVQASKRRARFVFYFAWTLILVNLAGVLWAIYLPLDFRFRFKYPDGLFITFLNTYIFTDRPFSSFIWSEQAPYALKATIVMGIFVLLALLQVLFLPRLMYLRGHDVPEVEAAEAAVKLASFSAWIILILGTASLIWDIRVTRQWWDTYELLQRL